MSRQAELAPFRGRGPGDPKRPQSQGRIASGDGVARLLRASPSAHLGGRREGREHQAWTHVHPSWTHTRDPSVISAPPCCGSGRRTARTGGASAPDARRNAPRQKGATLAAGAAILASPVLAPLASASSARPGVTKAEVAQKAAVSGEKTSLLSYGDTGEAVAAVQTQLRIPRRDLRPADRGRGEEFQLASGLAATGIVDAKTWVRALPVEGPLLRRGTPRSASVKASHRGQRRRRPGDVLGAVGGPDLEDRVELRDGSRRPRPARAGPGARGDAESAAARPHRRAAARPTAGSSRRSTATVTGSYGEDRGDHAHSGTDIAAPTGTTVRAADCGTVSVSGEESGYGQMVCVQHAGETTTCYAHLSERDVSVNEYVKAGQKIGEVGCTGSCTGPHVHFEVRQNGAATTPPRTCRARGPVPRPRPRRCRRARAGSAAQRRSSRPRCSAARAAPPPGATEAPPVAVVGLRPAGHGERAGDRRRSPTARTGTA